MNISRLTDKKLKTLKPKDKRYRIYIDSQPGLFLLIGTTGNITFQYRYQLNGQRREIKIGSYPARSLKNLLAEYSSFANQVQQEIDPLREKELKQQKEEDNPLFKEFAERFIANYVKKQLAPTTAKEYERQIRKHLIPAWGKRKLSDIQRAQIVKLTEKMSDSAPVQANRTLATIKKMFSYALNAGVTGTNPAAGIKPPAKETPKQRALELEEIRTLFNTLETLQDRDLRDILQLITLTAQRPGEVAEMRISQIKSDPEGLWFEISGDDTKNEEPQRIFLNETATRIIQNRIDDMNLDNYIFPARKRIDKPGDKPSSFMRKDVLVQKVRKLQSSTQEQAVKYFTAHDLRRSAATGIARLGHGAVVDDILNHKKQGVTRRVYDLYSRGPEIKRALTAWGETVQRAVDGSQAEIIHITQGGREQ